MWYKELRQKNTHQEQINKYLEEIYKDSVSITNIAFSVEHGIYATRLEKFVYEINNPGPLQKYIDKKWGIEQTEGTLINSIRYVKISDYEIALYLTFIGKDTKTLYYKQYLIQPYHYEIDIQTDSKTKEGMNECELLAIVYSISAVVIIALVLLIFACSN